MYAQKARHERIKIYSVEKSGNSPEPLEFEKKHVNAAGKSVKNQRRIATAWKRKSSPSKHANLVLILLLNIRGRMICIDVPFQIFEG
jgi:hypothetical protein